MPLLNCKNLSKSYGRKQVIKSMDLSIDGGEIVGLLGPNASGKTTLIKLIAGVLTANHGEITVNNSQNVKEFISYLPDRTYLDENMKVIEVLEFFQDFYKDFDMAKCTNMLTRLGILPYQKMKTMSKGTKEKVQLCLVMSRKAKLYLLDEPIGGVDPAAREFILNTIVSNIPYGSSVIISTHLLSDVEPILQRAIFLKDGEIVVNQLVSQLNSQNTSLNELFKEMFKC